MFIDSQRINYKISPLDQRYSRKLEDNLAGSHATFTDLETPGWSSIMRSQISQRTKRTNRQKQPSGLFQQDIYNKLNKVEQLQWSEEDERKMIRNRNNDKNQTRDTDRVRNINTNINNSVDKKVQEGPKRWNRISVHEYLYRNSKKMENKRMVQKILDQQYKKKEVLKFKPTINKKSIILAQSKFQRVKNNEQLVGKQENTVQTQATQAKQKQDRDVERYRLLNKTFYTLSDGNTLLSQQTLQNSLIKLPMPCIKVLQPIISKIYQGKQMEWLDFLQQFSSKSITGKQAFYSIMSKWFSRNETLQKDGEESRNIR